MKIAYIAHPIGGDVDGNIKKILEIIKKINLEEPDVVPFCPYMADVMALNDNVPGQRERGLGNARELMFETRIDELRLYGDHISEGMKQEVFWAFDFDIKVKAMTPGIAYNTDKVESEYNKHIVKEAEQKVIDNLLKDKS